MQPQKNRLAVTATAATNNFIQIKIFEANFDHLHIPHQG
jgi:hypothetical protein